MLCQSNRSHGVHLLNMKKYDNSTVLKFAKAKFPYQNLIAN